MRIDVLCESITEFMEETRPLLESIKEDVSSDSYERQFSRVYFSDEFPANSGSERSGFTTQMMRRQNDDELEVEDQGRGAAPMMRIGGQEFLETPD